MYYVCTGWPPQEEFFFWPAFVAQKMTPGHENPAMGFFLGCILGIESGREKKKTFGNVRKKNGSKPGSSSSDGRVRYRNRSGVVE